LKPVHGPARLRGVRTKLPGPIDATTLPGDTNGLHLRTASCVYYKDNRTPSLKFSTDIKDFLEVYKQSTVTWVNCPVDDVRKNACEVAQAFGFTASMIDRLLHGRYSASVDDDTEFGMMLPAVVMDSGKVGTHVVFVLIKEGLILTIHGRHVTRFARFIRYAEVFIKKIHPDWSRADQLTMVLLRLIDENNRRNFMTLKAMTGEVDNLQRAFANENLGIAKVAMKVQRIRHTLVKLLSVLWENYDIMRILQQGDIMLLSTRPELLDKFNKIKTENSRYIQLGENLANIIGSGAEAMQDYYQIRLVRMNNVLSFASTWLGILGTIFLVPNTLATAMSVSSYNLGPGDAWWYTILLIVATALSSVATFLVIRKMWDVTLESIEKRRMVLMAPTRR
jgi:Mg2+ and Co2+ transporter CorA